MSSHTQSPPGVITLGDLTLRSWSAADAPAFAEAVGASDAHLRAFTPWVVDGRVPGLSFAERLARHAAAFVAGDEWVYGLFDAHGGALGGFGIYPRVGPGAVELGYWLAAGATGRGLATRATAALVRASFAMPGVDRIEIRCDARNAPSARIPERLGFRVTSTLPLPPDGELQVWTLGIAEHLARPEFTETAERAGTGG